MLGKASKSFIVPVAANVEQVIMGQGTSQPPPVNRGVLTPPTAKEIPMACAQNSISDLKTILDHHDQFLLQEVARRGTGQLAAYVLDRVSTSAEYPDPLGLGRKPHSLKAEQFLLEHAAMFGNVDVIEYLLARGSDLDLQSHTLGCHAMEGGVEIWQVLLRHQPGLKNQHYGHAGSVVEHCVKHDHIDLLRYLLEQGAAVEDEDRPILQMAEVMDASDEIKGLLVKYGANVDWE